MISLIVAKSQNNVIGHCNDLPWYLPADLKHFKQITDGHAVVMGRKTFDSIIARLGKPLPNRTNIVVTRQEDFVYPGVDVIHSIKDINTLNGEVYVIGGANIYSQMINYADKLYVTEIKTIIDGDTHFPSIDPDHWQEISRSRHKADDKNQYDYDFVVYTHATM